jgi:hypothetical protein
MVPTTASDALGCIPRIQRDCMCVELHTLKVQEEGLQVELELELKCLKRLLGSFSMKLSPKNGQFQCSVPTFGDLQE